MNTFPAILVGLAFLPIEPEVNLLDALRFPPKEVCLREIKFANNFKKFVENRCEFDSYYKWQTEGWSEELSWRLHVWQEMAAIQTGFEYVQRGNWRSDWYERSLSGVRSTLGPEAYRDGILPEIVPLSYFTRCDP